MIVPSIFNRKFEVLVSTITCGVLLLMVVMPVLETLLRLFFDQGISGSIHYVRHGTLWVGFMGAVITAIEGRHISISATGLLTGRNRDLAKSLAHGLSTFTCVVLAVAAYQMVLSERQSLSMFGGGFPLWLAQAVMPLSLLLLSLIFAEKLLKSGVGRVIFMMAIIVFSLSYFVEFNSDLLLLLALIAIFIATLAGAPLFVALGSLAALLFFSIDIPLASVSVEAYRIAANPILPTIPLFTLAGAVMAAGSGSTRLVRLFRALFDWMPGGTAIAAICVCAFFTTFTGGSGVTILAMGGLMFSVLLKQGYQRKFSIGLITSSGSLGVLFPPSLLVILYGVAANTPINKLFVAGVVPGVILILSVCIYAIYNAERSDVSVKKFDVKQAVDALIESKWDVSLPVIMIYGIFSGKATLVEVAAFSALYTLVVEFFVLKGLTIRRDLRVVLQECSVMVGGVIIILSSAMGLASYFVFQDVPELASEWIQSVTTSPWVFLLALNFFLLLAGCLLDIFSAIVVVVPLIVPVSSAFGVDPVHLGILFLVNMELGYLTPPVGMNLYLASFRFKEGLVNVFRSSVPFFLINLTVVLIVTFIPEITSGVSNWFYG